MRFGLGWIIGSPSLSHEERNKRLEETAVTEEKRAELLEKEAVIRARLVTAQLRSKKAKQKMVGGQSSSRRWLLIVVVAVCIVLFFALRSCGGA